MKSLKLDVSAKKSLNPKILRQIVKSDDIYYRNINNIIKQIG